MTFPLVLQRSRNLAVRKFRNYCIIKRVHSSTVAAKHHENGSAVDCANKAIPSLLNRIVRSEPRNLLFVATIAAKIYEDTCREHMTSLPLELLYSESPHVAEPCQPIHADPVAHTAQKSLQRRLQSFQSPKLKSPITFRENLGCISRKMVADGCAQQT